MPKRSNVFQDVVGMIQRQIAGIAAVEESGELENTRTRKKREVDIVVRGKLGGHDLVVGIEAHDTSTSSRPATVEWVERMMGKHQNLGTDKVVLVSEIGFTKQALKLAAEEHIATLTPRDLTDGDPIGMVVNSWSSIEQKTLEMVPRKMAVFVGDATAEDNVEMQPHDRMVFLDGDVLGSAAHGTCQRV